MQPLHAKPRQTFNHDQRRPGPADSDQPMLPQFPRSLRTPHQQSDNPDQLRNQIDVEYDPKSNQIGFWLNHDLEQYQPSKSDLHSLLPSLVDIIDRKYGKIYKDSTEKSPYLYNDLASQQQMSVDALYGQQIDKLGVYDQEFQKQNNLFKDNQKLDKEIRNYQKLPNYGMLGEQQNQKKRKRPQTAKTNQTNAVQLQRELSFQQIDELDLSQEIDQKSPKGEHQYQNISSQQVASVQPYQQRFSQSRSRGSNSKSNKRKQNEPQPNQNGQRARPRSAYISEYQNLQTQQRLKKVSSQQKLRTDQSSSQGRKVQNVKHANGRVQSAKERQPRAQYVDHQPAKERKRVRPQNRPKNVRLGDIDEFCDGSGDSETQMIYSGRHTGSQDNLSYKDSQGQVIRNIQTSQNMKIGEDQLSFQNKNNNAQPNYNTNEDRKQKQSEWMVRQEQAVRPTGAAQPDVRGRQEFAKKEKLVKKETLEMPASAKQSQQERPVSAKKSSPDRQEKVSREATNSKTSQGRKEKLKNEKAPLKSSQENADKSRNQNITKTGSWQQKQEYPTFEKQNAATKQSQEKQESTKKQPTIKSTSQEKQDKSNQEPQSIQSQKKMESKRQDSNNSAVLRQSTDSKKAPSNKNVQKKPTSNQMKKDSSIDKIEKDSHNRRPSQTSSQPIKALNQAQSKQEQQQKEVKPKPEQKKEVVNQMPADKKPDVVVEPQVVDQAGNSPGPLIANIIINDTAENIANEDGAPKEIATKNSKDNGEARKDSKSSEKAPKELPKADSRNGPGATRSERRYSSTPSQSAKPQTVDKKETPSQEPIQQKPSKSSTSKDLTASAEGSASNPQPQQQTAKALKTKPQLNKRGSQDRQISEPDEKPPIKGSVKSQEGRKSTGKIDSPQDELLKTQKSLKSNVTISQENKNIKNIIKQETGKKEEQSQLAELSKSKSSRPNDRLDSSQEGKPQTSGPRGAKQTNSKPNKGQTDKKLGKTLKSGKEDNKQKPPLKREAQQKKPKNLEQDGRQNQNADMKAVLSNKRSNESGPFQTQIAPKQGFIVPNVPHDENAPNLDELYGRINYAAQLADQLQYSDDGTSGYKEGESQFNEEYDEDYQKSSTTKKQKMELPEGQSENKETLLTNLQKSIEEKIFSPYKKLQQLRDYREEEQEEIERLRAEIEAERARVDVGTIRKNFYKKLEDQMKKDKKDKELLKKVTAIAQKSLRMQNRKHLVYDESSLMKAEQLTLKDVVLSNQHPDYKEAIEEHKELNLDKERIEACFNYKNNKTIQLDQSPYISDKYGLCQLIFMYRQKCHVLQIRVYQAHDTLEEMKNDLKVNRDVSLTEFNIQKPLKIERSIVESEETENTLFAKQQQQYKEIIGKLIKIVREIKRKRTGDIYNDFYYHGEPADASFASEADGVQVSLLEKEKLMATIHEELVKRIQARYFASDAYLRSKVRQRRIQSGQRVLKKKRTYEEHIVMIQHYAKLMLKLRDARWRIAMRGQLDARKVYRTVATFLKTVPLQAIAGHRGRAHQKQLFLRINIQVSGDASELKMIGYDQTPCKREKYFIKPFTSEIDEEILEIIQANKEFIYEMVKVRIMPNSDPEDQMLQFYPNIFNKRRLHALEEEMNLYKACKGIHAHQINQQAALGLIKQQVDQIDIASIRRDAYEFEEYDNGSDCSSTPDVEAKVEGVEAERAPILFSSLTPQEQRRYWETRHSLYQQLQLVDGIDDETAYERQARQNRFMQRFRSKMHQGHKQLLASQKQQQSLVPRAVARYDALFRYRQDVRQQREYFSQGTETAPRQDEDMWRHSVRNDYEYAILKIQKWWRRRAVRYIVEKMAACRKPDQADQANSSDDDAAPESDDEKIKKRVAIIDQELSMIHNQMAGAGATRLNRMFKLTLLVRRAKKRLLKLAKKEGRNILYRAVYEKTEQGSPDLAPFNYTVEVEKVPQQDFLFRICMVLNNKPDHKRPFIEVMHNIDPQRPGKDQNKNELQLEVEFLRFDQRKYFEHLIHERIKFAAYNDQDLRASVSKHYEAKPGGLGLAYLLRSGRYKDFLLGIPTGQYLVEPFIRSKLNETIRSVMIQAQNNGTLQVADERPGASFRNTVGDTLYGF